MKKTIFAILICFLLLCIIFICSFSTYENVTFIERNGEQRLLYQDNEYYVFYALPTSTVTEYLSTANENDIKLGWYYSFPFSTEFYSNTADNPVYIYSVGFDNCVYLKQGFDYKEEIFTINDTSLTIAYSDIATKDRFTYDPLTKYDYSKQLVMYSQSYPDFKISLQVFSENNNWYVAFRTNEAYSASQAFITLLEKYEIING